jgi:hypothetical protein
MKNEKLSIEYFLKNREEMVDVFEQIKSFCTSIKILFTFTSIAIFFIFITLSMPNIITLSLTGLFSALTCCSLILPVFETRDLYQLKYNKKIMFSFFKFIIFRNENNACFVRYFDSFLHETSLSTIISSIKFKIDRFDKNDLLLHVLDNYNKLTNEDKNNILKNKYIIECLDYRNIIVVNKKNIEGKIDIMNFIERDIIQSKLTSF